jgi:hypothetical protein
MADKEKSFEDLVKEAPAGGTGSLVGTLAQSSEAGAASSQTRSRNLPASACRSDGQ